jgi:hypothetical protein
MLPYMSIRHRSGNKTAKFLLHLELVGLKTPSALIKASEHLSRLNMTVLKSTETLAKGKIQGIN